MTRLVWLFFILSGTCAYGQRDISASFPGGDEAYNQFLQENLVFPETAVDTQVNRTVKVLVDIDSTGKATLDTFITPYSNLGLEEAVERFIKLMPNWNPAVHNGVRAQTQVILSINFHYVNPEDEYDEYSYKYYEESDIPPSFVGGIDSVNRFVCSVLREELLLSIDTASAKIKVIVGKDNAIIDAVIVETDHKVGDGYWTYAVMKLTNAVAGSNRGKRVNVQSFLSVSCSED